MSGLALGAGVSAGAGAVDLYEAGQQYAQQMMREISNNNPLSHRTADVVTQEQQEQTPLPLAAEIYPRLWREGIVGKKRLKSERRAHPAMFPIEGSSHIGVLSDYMVEKFHKFPRKPDSQEHMILRKDHFGRFFNKFIANITGDMKLRLKSLEMEDGYYFKLNHLFQMMRVIDKSAFESISPLQLDDRTLPILYSTVIKHPDKDIYTSIIDRFAFSNIDFEEALDFVRLQWFVSTFKNLQFIFFSDCKNILFFCEHILFNDEIKEKPTIKNIRIYPPLSTDEQEKLQGLSPDLEILT